jgi:hypothetical protein
MVQVIWPDGIDVGAPFVGWEFTDVAADIVYVPPHVIQLGSALLQGQLEIWGCGVANDFGTCHGFGHFGVFNGGQNAQRDFVELVGHNTILQMTMWWICGGGWRKLLRGSVFLEV